MTVLGMLLAAGGDQTFQNWGWEEQKRVGGSDSCQPMLTGVTVSGCTPHMLHAGHCFIRRKARQLLTTLHPLRILCPLPHCPSAPPDSPKLQITFSPGEAIVNKGNSVNMTSPGEAIVKKGDSVTMKCQIISSNPQYKTMSWFKDGNHLSEQETLHREQKTVTLTLSSVTKQMTGNYHCEAQNDIGSTKLEVTLQVHCEPPGSCGRVGS